MRKPYSQNKEKPIMQISVTELKINPGKYLDLVKNEEIYITRNGKRVARLTGMQPHRRDAARALFGILPSHADLDASRQERLK
jgi:prevent-host-death family protein